MDLIQRYTKDNNEYLDYVKAKNTIKDYER